MKRTPRKNPPIVCSQMSEENSAQEPPNLGSAPSGTTSARWSDYIESGIYVYKFPINKTDIQGKTPQSVLMIHGSMDRGTSFSRLHNCLTGFATTTYDRRGYHRSRLAGRDLPTSFSSQIDDAMEVMSRKRFLVFGHSYGATIALALGYRFPEYISCVIAFEPPQPWRDWWPTHQRNKVSDQVSPQDVAENFIRRMIGDDRWDRLPQRTKLERRSEGPAFVLELAQLRETGCPFEVTGFQIPVTIVRGSNTSEHQIRGTNELANEIPHANFCEIQGAGHGAHLSHARQVASIIEKESQSASLS